MKAGKAMIGFATAMLLVFAAAPAHAKNSGGASCVEKNNTSVDKPGTDGSECFASSDGTSTAKSNATGGSFADAEVATGGKANAVGTGGSFSEATSDTHGQSIAHSTQGSRVTATSDEHGVAKGNASGGSEADASAFGKCNAKAKATGGSLAVAACATNGGFVHAVATGGGDAEGSDTGLPTCNPGSGTAKVRSSGGNCGP